MGSISEPGPTAMAPVPVGERRLSELDLAVLWGDLSVGLLVLAAGALLVPALGLPAAAVAIVVGSLLGSIPLGLVGVAGAREGLPGMVLFRPVLGVRGSWLPSVLNIAQLVGWAALEFWAIARVADAVSQELFGFSAFGLWLVLAVIGCTALALGGPVLVVRLWLERFGAWVLLACGLWLTWRLLDLAGEAWSTPGTGGWPTFPLAVDLVIAMCVSWLPLVADYDRFARGRAFAGTFLGFAVGNAWFFMLGAMLMAAGGTAADPIDIGSAVTHLTGGVVVLILLVVAESDEAFANIYSAAVSVRNLAPRLPQSAAIIGVSVVSAGLAAFVTMGTYQLFLLLIGSLFVPLFGVFLAAYFLKGRRGGVSTAFDPRAATAWLVGFLVFQWSAPTGPDWWIATVERVVNGWLGLPLPLFGGTWGGSIPGFVAAFAAAMILVRKRAEEP